MDSAIKTFIKLKISNILSSQVGFVTMLKLMGLVFRVVPLAVVVLVLLPVPGTVVDPEAVLEVVLVVDPGTVAVLEAVHEVVPGIEAVLGVDLEVVPGTEAVLEVVPETVAVLEVVPGTVAVPEVGLGIEAVLGVVLGIEAVLGLGLGIETVLEVGPGIEAVPALAEEEHNLAVAEEKLRVQTEGELADQVLSHAWALHSCQYLAWEAPCEAGDIPEDSHQGDHNPLGAWRGCWGRGNPGASDPWPSSSAPPPASDDRSSGTPPQ